MTVLLITGAGASRNLGHEGTLMPLMGDWSDALCTSLDAEESGLAGACHLASGLDGPEFERSLGLLLRWQQVRDLEERFQGLGGQSPGEQIPGVIRARKSSTSRLEAVMRAINVTLYEQFGQHRIDDVRAEVAYGALLKELGNPEIILATTNYDRASESALSAVGHEVDAGFRSSPQRTPKLEPAGLIAERGNKTPVIHLHGAVGWYERDGSVIEHHPDQPFNPTLGIPVVLYPDPEKDPTSDALVSELWAEFHAAIDLAEAVLVIGHSLHDPPLVRALRRTARSKPVVISYLGVDGAKYIKGKVPGARPVEIDFGPELEADKQVRMQLKGLRHPARLTMR
jgi:hypothetical protein